MTAFDLAAFLLLHGYLLLVQCCADLQGMELKCEGACNAMAVLLLLLLLPAAAVVLAAGAMAADEDVTVVLRAQELPPMLACHPQADQPAVCGVPCEESAMPQAASCHPQG